MRSLVVKNFGGIYQLVVRDDQDLERIDQLDPARWAATSAPLRDLHCDPALLGFVDPEGKGRLRVSGLLAARDWLFARLSNRAGLNARSDVLVLAHLDPARPEGEKLRHAALHVIDQLKLADRERLSLEQVRAFQKSYAQTLANGDGVIPPELLPDAEAAAFVKDAVAVVGGEPDASGKQGLSQAGLDRFLERGKAWLAWNARPATETALRPLGEDTAAQAALVKALAPKVDEYFLQCELLRQEAQGPQALRLTPEDLKGLRARDLPSLERLLSAAPLSTPTPEGLLPSGAGVNALWADRVAQLRKKVLPRALGSAPEAITVEDWRKVVALFEPFHAWQALRPEGPFDAIPCEKLEAYLAGPLPGRAAEFIALDKAALAEVEQAGQLEKTVLLQRWLLELANNLVNFSKVYAPTESALVEMGSLVIDARRLDFCIKVEDRAAHKKVAAESLIFLVYAQILDQDTKAPVYEVAAPVTSGERGRLRVGKRGIFQDLAGKEWDAVIVDLCENPISVAEAMRAPFRRAKAFVGKKIEELAGSQLEAREKAAQAQIGGQVAAVGSAAAPPPTPAAPAKKDEPPKPAAPGGGIGNLLLGGGIAFAALGSALAYIVSAFASVKPLNAVLTVFGLLVVVALISGLLGWLKLRRRDMALLFEASGWAVNVHMKITRRIGRVFTRVPALPPGTTIDAVDALAGADEARTKARRRRLWLLFILVVLALLAWAATRGFWLTEVQ